MAFRSRIALCVFILCLLSVMAWAGGPLVVGGPAVGNRPRFGVDGEPFTWDPAKVPIAYRVDPGPMSVSPSGTVVIDHPTGVQRVQGMFGVWQAVSTANISFTNAGALLPAGSYTGGDLTTVQQFNDVMGSCRSGVQSPIIFDADGKLMALLGLSPGVIGFNSGCALDSSSGMIVSSAVTLNGEFQDKVQDQFQLPGRRPNFELSQNSFDEAITHEIGHFLGLDHSQINLDLLFNQNPSCDLDGLAGLPLMFPVLVCQARKDVGLPTLSHDDLSWISRLYPNASTVQNFGTITGTIFFADGVSAAQDANVIARLVDDPSTPEDESRRVAVSAVSGYLFTGNPGQNVTTAPSDNTNGSMNGSRDPALIGFYEIALPPGTYTVEIEQIDTAFAAGSGVGPINPPAPTVVVPEFWNTDESAFDIPLQRDSITVHAGEKISDVDIIMNVPFPRFDQNEDSGRLQDTPVVLPLAPPEDASA
jgi:hypothetical protein